MAAAPVPYTKAAAVAPGYNWTGFYVGAMGGYGWSRTGGVDFNGGFAGGTIGANWQMSNIVLGIEGEGAWSNIGQNHGGRSNRRKRPHRGVRIDHGPLSVSRSIIS